MVITYIHSNYLADQTRIQVRCRNMADAINRSGMHRANLLDINSFAQNTSYAQRICDESDLLVIHRYLLAGILVAIQYWKARDKKIIVDFDQAVNYLTDDMPAYAFWFEGRPLDGMFFEDMPYIDPLPIEQFKWGLAMVDAATVPSDRLADDWSGYTKIYKIPDYINTSHYPALRQNHGDEVLIGIGSHASSHLEKSGLISAMENICHARPQVKFILHGAEIEFSGMVSGQFKTCPQHRVEDWANVLPDLSIGLLPMFGEYDLCTGYFDLLEFMISKIPWIASGDAASTPLMRYGQKVQNTASSWESAILNTLDQLDTYQRKAAKESFLYALNQDISANVNKILSVYAAVIKH